MYKEFNANPLECFDWIVLGGSHDSSVLFVLNFCCFEFFRRVGNAKEKAASALIWMSYSCSVILARSYDYILSPRGSISLFKVLLYIFFLRSSSDKN